MKTRGARGPPMNGLALALLPCPVRLAREERGSLEKLLLCLPRPGRFRLITLIRILPGTTRMGFGFDGFYCQPLTATLAEWLW